MKEPLMGSTADIEGIIFKIKRFAVHDGPGLRTTVFLKGCPLNCIWCHSPEGISNNITIWYNESKCISCGECISTCPESALRLSDTGNKASVIIDRNRCNVSGNCVQACPSTALQFTGYISSVKKIITAIEKDVIYYKASGGGVTLTGGEPLSQPEFSYAILNECKKKGIHTAIETSLYCDSGVLKKIADFTDLFLIDLKIFDEDQHSHYTGRSNSVIKENFAYLAGLGKNIIVRIPMVDGITNSPENISSIREFVDTYNDNIIIENIKFNPLAINNYKKLDIPFLLK